VADHTFTATPVNRLAILYVDDEETSLKHFKNIFEEKFTVLTASNAQEGLQVLEENKDNIGILMTDQRMPGEKGTQVLEKVRNKYPTILRILITAYADIETAEDAVNTGGIYKYVRKPWDIPQLENTLMHGLALFAFRKMRDQFAEERLSVLKENAGADHNQNLLAFTSMLSRYLRDPVADLKLFIDGMSEQRFTERFRDISSEKLSHFGNLLIPISTQVDRMYFILSRLDEAGVKSRHEEFRPIRIQEVVSQAIERLKSGFKEKRIEIENNIPEDLPLLNASPAMLQRLFGLFLEDELSIMPERGRLKLSAKSISGTAPKDTRIQIEIDDDGPRFGEESHDPIFEPFHIRSRDPKELGLNLWVCLFIIHDHGGKIEARNNQRGGTTFRITIPSTTDGPLSIRKDVDFFREIVWNDAIWEYLHMEKCNYDLLECVLDAYQRERDA